MPHPAPPPVPSLDLAAIHARWAGRCHAYLAAVLGSRAEAEALLGEVLQLLHHRQAQVLAAEDPDAYALRCATNAARSWLRSEIRRRHREHPTDTRVLMATTPAPGHPALEPDAVGRITAALAALPPEQREVVALKIWDGRTFADIAQICDCSPNTAASRWRYACARLRSQLEGLIDDA